MSERPQDILEKGDIRIGLVRPTPAEKVKRFRPMTLAEIEEKFCVKEINPVYPIKIIKPKESTS